VTENLSDKIHTNFQIDGPKLVYNVIICLGNDQDNFQLHRFTISENIANSFKGLLFGSHCSLTEYTLNATHDSTYDTV